jgi:hypothetical protein
MPAMSTLPRTSHIVAYVALLITAVSLATMAVRPSPRDLSKLARPGMVATKLSTKAATAAMTANQSLTDGMAAAPTSALNGAVIDKAFEGAPQVVAQRRK